MIRIPHQAPIRSGPIGKAGAVWLAICLVLVAGPVLSEPAAGPDRPLADPVQEARAKALFEEVRCIVCQHESISDSPAGLATDMRRLVREEIESGASDEAVRQDLVRRWGDYILFKPPVRLSTGLLWFGPFILVLLGGLMLVFQLRKKRSGTPPLSEDEQARLKALLSETGFRPDPDANPRHD